MWMRFGAVMLLNLALSGAAWAQTPDGFQDILKGVERGKRFHPVWPPIIGQSPLGILVSADNPAKIRATFETIEGPDHRRAGVEFGRGRTDYVPPELTSNKQRAIKVDVSEIIGLFNQGGGAASAPTQGAAAKPAGEKPSDTPKEGSTTGVDWSKVSQVTRKSGIVSVEYYTLGTLNAMTGNDAVGKPTKEFMTKEKKGWVMHRVLRIDGIEYELTGKTDFDVNFRAGLLKWLPGVSVDWASARTLVLKVPVPVYIGYKLWRPGENPAGAAGQDLDLEGLTIIGVEIGADEIVKELKQRGSDR
jgi:hypothetical protein